MLEYSVTYSSKHVSISYITSLQHRPQLVERELKRLTSENELLREQLRLARVAKYGPASEKLNDAQLSLLEGEPGVSLNPQDVAAARIAVSINGLFAVDALARELSLEQRHQLRGGKSAPLLASLHEELKKLQYQVLPAGALGKAPAYTLTLWPKLIRVLDHPELELSNNFAENSMRGVALCRKNWIHIGSENAGPKVAAILSVVESCKRLGVAARSYLAKLLPGLKDLKIQEIATRSPAAWVNSRSKA